MPTRRHFVTSAFGGGLYLLGSSTAGATSAQFGGHARSRPRPHKRLGVALLGLGRYASGQLAPALQQTQYCHLAGIVTGTPSKVKTWQARYDIAEDSVYSYESLPQIAKNPTIDVVYIVVPTGLHAKYAIMAAAAGKHVFCEKPMAMTVEECDAIIATCKRNRVRLAIGYRMQHEPNTQTVIGFAKTKSYGPIERVRALAGYRGRGRTGWRYDQSMGGGALYDMGVYSINGLRHASGLEPTQVRFAKQKRAHGVDLTTEFELSFPDDIIGYGRTSFREDINHLRVDCRDGWYELKPMQRYRGVTGRTSDGLLLDKQIDNQQAQQMDDDAFAILHDMPLLVPGEEGRRDIALVEAIHQAARLGRSVTLSSTARGSTR